MLNFEKLFVFLITLIFVVNVVCGEKVSVIELTTGWKLRNQNGSIDLSVSRIPSGVYTALSGIYGNVLQSYNDVNLRWISYDNWTYTKSFSVNLADHDHVRSVNLTLHGVDTVATVRLNDMVIGHLDNMFVRYSFDVLPYLKAQNVLEIEIHSPVHMAKQRADELKAKGISAPPDCPSKSQHGECHRNMLRKMQTSFGGEWNLAAPSMGIWKSVTLEYYEVAIMRDIDVAMRRNNSHWIMDIRVFLSSDVKQDFTAELIFVAADLLDKPVIINTQRVSYASPIIEFKQEIPIGNVELWWPNGYGKQKLYPLYFTANCWHSSGENVTERPHLRLRTISHKSLKVGFRTVELVEDVVDSGRTFFFKVNDVEIFAKGANYIPSHMLPEQFEDQDRVGHILKSAKEAHMNMIRVWGGGIYESDYFYSMTDYLGLLVWQDMAFTSATYPITDDFVEAVRRETIQNAKRLAHHPSLAILVTNDEVELNLVKNTFDTDLEYERFTNEYRQLFVGTIKHELNFIARSDFSPRPGPLKSTPSNGMDDRKDLPAKPQDPNYGDVHIRDDNKDSWDPETYPRPRFATEYGFQSLPILISWQRTLAKGDNLRDLIEHRQHDPKASQPMETLVRRHLPLPSADAENYVESLIYLSQVAQAMATKVATELFRSQRLTERRTMGALYWQLNDAWVAPTWSSIDFYGNYKLIYYWSREFLAPTAIIAQPDVHNNAINVTLVRDEHNVDPDVFDVSMNMYLWSEVYPIETRSWQTILLKSDAKLKILPMNKIFNDTFTTSNGFLEFVLRLNNQFISRTYYFPSNILEVQGIMDPKLTFQVSWRYCNLDTTTDIATSSYSLTIRVRHPAIFVYIEVLHPAVEKYKLSYNGFMQVEPVKTVHLEFQYKSECLQLTSEHFSVKTVNQYMA